MDVGDFVAPTRPGLPGALTFTRPPSESSFAPARHGMVGRQPADCLVAALRRVPRAHRPSRGTMSWRHRGLTRARGRCRRSCRSMAPARTPTMARSRSMVLAAHRRAHHLQRRACSSSSGTQEPKKDMQQCAHPPHPSPRAGATAGALVLLRIAYLTIALREASPTPYMYVCFILQETSSA